VIAVLPISLNGLGMREAALAAFLAPHVSDPAMIVAAGLAWQAVMFAAGLIGGAIQLISREKPAALTTGGSEL
ncbi:MAG: hypothetical protein KDA62_23615, partial [Planctomycetales bacterium]|nr:hypothetical protein [Planctomycetales bacterium]